MKSITIALLAGAMLLTANESRAVDDASPLGEKAEYLLQDLLDKHWLDGLYISIVPSAPHGTKLPHTVEEPGNVIHAGVWTGRYLGGVGYEYAVTKDPRARERGGEILKALRILQEVTGKPGLLARIRQGHGPVMDWEREGPIPSNGIRGGALCRLSLVRRCQYRQLQRGPLRLRDLLRPRSRRRAKKFIARYRPDDDASARQSLPHHRRRWRADDVGAYRHRPRSRPGRLLPENLRAADEILRREECGGVAAARVADAPSRSSDAHRRNHRQGRYLDLYNKVVARYKANPEPEFFRQPFSLEKLARTDHSSEGQSYEAIYNLIRYEKDPELRTMYRGWLMNLWESNWMEEFLFTYMTLARDVR
jgi:hypothetical protein